MPVAATLSDRQHHTCAFSMQNKMQQHSAVALVVCDCPDQWSHIPHCLSNCFKDCLICNLCQATRTVYTRPCTHWVPRQFADALIPESVQSLCGMSDHASQQLQEFLAKSRQVSVCSDMTRSSLLQSQIQVLSI